jgi:PAS domain S-box-containing protein
MKPLRHSIKPSTAHGSVWGIVLIVLALQLLLLAVYYFTGAQRNLDWRSPTWQLLLAYSAAMGLVGLWAAVLRARWHRQESLVRQRLLDVIDAIPDPAVVRDVRGRYVLWNKAAEAYHGIKVDYVYLKTPFELFPQGVAQTIAALDAQAMESNTSVIRRLELPPLYGKSKRVAIIRVAPVSSANESGVRGTVTILHDVTEAELESAQLKYLSTQLQIALDTSGFGSWVWDLDNDVLTCSVQFQRLLRYCGDHFRRDFVFRERLHPDERERVLDAVQSAIQHQTRFEQDYQLQAFDGHYLPFRGSGQCAQDANGKHYFAGLLQPRAE